jgi:histidinol-phosphate aminotransferase
MNLCDLAPQYIRDIAPYQPGKPSSELARELGLDPADIVKLASNENPLGVSPKAMAAIERLLPELALYPDGNGFELKAVIAQKYALDHANLVLGNGSNDILELAARTFLTAANSAVFSQHAFAVYPLVVKAMGARGIEVPARDFGHDLEAMLAAIEPDTRLMFIANPNNPTGTFIDPATLRAALARVPAGVLVLLDEAYTEYLPPELRVDSARWVAEMPNLIVSRTFSKAYGLAGLRVGYGIGDAEVIGLMNRVRQPFNVNQLALAAAAAALNDEAFLARGFDNNRRGMAQLIAGFEAQGLEYIPSFGNFICVKLGTGDNAAGPVFQRLLRKGVIVRPIASYGLPEYLRISIGTETENGRFLVALAQAMADQ